MEDGLLGQLLAPFPVTDDPGRQSERDGLVPHYQFIKCPALTLLGAAHKFFVSHRHGKRFFDTPWLQLSYTCSLVV